jgi:hypothetical protein
MALDAGLTLFYTFLAFLQIYIYFTAGTITGYKKIWTTKSQKTIPELLIKFFRPIYAILELSRMASWPNIEIMWLLILSVLLAISIGLLVAYAFQKIFKLDVRYKRTYPYVLAMPSLGTLPLVMGRALCYPGGMLEGDPQCVNIQGFMMMNFLIFEMSAFTLGFLFMPEDANFTNILMEKMSYTMHILVGKIFDKNYQVLNIFLRYMKDEKTARKLFDSFEKKYKLELIDNEKIVYRFTEDQSVELDFNLEGPIIKSPKKNELQQEIDVLQERRLESDEEVKSNINDSFIKDKSKSWIEPTSGYLEHSINFSRENENKPVELPPFNEFSPTSSEFYNKENFNRLPSLEIEKHDINHKISHDEGSLKNVCIENLPNSDLMNMIMEDIVETDFIVSNSIRQSTSHYEDKNIPHDIEFKNLNSTIAPLLFHGDAELYYSKVFAFVENHLIEERIKEFHEFKIHTEKDILHFPPKFPTVKNLTINSDMCKVINQEWNKLFLNVKKINPEFKMSTIEVPVSFNIILSKIHSPPVIGCFLGLLIGMSSMREVLFSNNHYIANIVDGIQVVTKATVPFLYVNLGISILAIKNLNPLNTPLDKKYIILSFLHRNIVIPAIGLFYIYLWKTFYGGMVLASKVFRISMFMPFCLPCSTTVSVVFSIVKYFHEEAGFILFTHIITMLINLTVLYLIYAVVEG